MPSSQPEKMPMVIGSASAGAAASVEPSVWLSEPVSSPVSLPQAARVRARAVVVARTVPRRRMFFMIVLSCEVCRFRGASVSWAAPAGRRRWGPGSVLGGPDLHRAGDRCPLAEGGGHAVEVHRDDDDGEARLGTERDVDRSEEHTSELQ